MNRPSLFRIIRIEKGNKMKGRRGFTMVELIVVLVIIAIFASVAIPTLIGYIDSAKETDY